VADRHFTPREVEALIPALTPRLSVAPGRSLSMTLAVVGFCSRRKGDCSGRTM